MVRGAEVGSTDSHILHSRVDRPCIGKARLPFPGSFGGEQGGPGRGAVAGRELGGAGDARVPCGPLWQLLGQVDRKEGSGGHCVRTFCEPGRPAALTLSSFSLSPSSLNPPLPIWPPLTLASPEPLGVCSYEGRRGRGRSPFLNLLWASPGPR